MQKIRQLFGSIELGRTIPSIIQSIIRNRGNLAAAAIEAALKGIEPASTPLANVTAIRNALNTLMDDSDGSTFEEIMDGERYLASRHEREKNFNYEQVMRDFEDDILALRDGLLNAFVFAIDLDKAFSAKESALIENIVGRLQTDQFGEFVADNLHLIRKDELEKIYGDRAQKELDRAVMSEIRAILNEIGTVGLNRGADYATNN